MKKQMAKFSLALLLLTLAWGPVSAVAGPATEAVRLPIHEGLSLLQDRSVQSPAQKKAQADKMWDILRRAFDFRLISALALGPNWKRFSPDQRVEFADVFATLLGNTYITKIQGEYKDEQVLFVGEEIVSKRKAVVKTIIKRQSQELPVDYKMRFRKGAWKVYDLRVEGIGLVLNYRRQFTTFLSKEAGTPEALIEKLKGKIEPKAGQN